ASLEAMHGRFDEARELHGRSRAILEELGMTFSLAARALVPAAIEMLAADYEAAERELLYGYNVLSDIGENELRSTIAAVLGQTLYELGRDDEAEQYTLVSEGAAAEDDFPSHVIWRGARAKVLARRDGDPGAEGLAREGIGLAATTDCLAMHGAAL